jgi:CxxC motif-containing protein (DUF1111 family)
VTDLRFVEGRSHVVAPRVVFPITLALLLGSVVIAATPSQPKTKTAATASAVDPGVRGGAPGAGTFLNALSSFQDSEEPDFTAAFTRVNTVLTTPGVRGGGLGPRFNSNSCASCHAQPAVGGSSPANNPLFSVYNASGATNTMPTFITGTGPVLVPIFLFQVNSPTQVDGHIHQLFTIAGRSDATGCTITQPNFANQLKNNNVVFRQPIPLFGDGLIDIVLDTDILANQAANQTSKTALGITGHPNISQGDQLITRFGWKAQVKSLQEMSMLEAQVEKGVTNPMFPNELDETSGCVLNGVPEDMDNYDATTATSPQRDQYASDAFMAASFARLMDQPVPAVVLGTTNGQTQFNNVGCVLCHTQSFTTPPTPELSNANERQVNNASKIVTNLFSDLLVHHMGPCLADGVVAGTAQGDEWRTAPLWGVGQRVFFMHDGRTTDIVQAIEDHFCAANTKYQASEANAVINNFNALSQQNQQDLVTFLRNL